MDTILSNAEPEVVQDNPVVSPAPAPEPVAAAPYDYGTMIGEGGALSDNWREGLPEAIRQEKCLDSIKNIGTLAQSYVHAQHAMGSGKIAIPTDKSTPEEWAAFYKAGGRPDSADGYNSDTVQLPEGIDLDPEQVKAFREFAFNNGVSQKTFAAALAFDVARVQRAQADAAAREQAEYNDTLHKLQTEFGGDFNNRIAQCNRALDVLGLRDTFARHGLLNNYTVIKALSDLGGKLSETRLPSGSPQPGDSLQSRLDSITGNREDPYYNREDPRHDARVDEVRQLLSALAASR